MNEFLNELVYQSNDSISIDKVKYSNKRINIKQIAVSSTSSLRITLNSL